jgi:hypothetical protein
MPKFFLYAYISFVNAQRKIIDKEREKLDEDAAPDKVYKKINIKRL